jgi:hypothetical protein
MPLRVVWKYSPRLLDCGKKATAKLRCVMAQAMNQQKFDALVHYICARCDAPAKLGATKLNKVLWYSDAAAYLSKGHSITGATYIKRQYGPVPKGIMAARQRLVLGRLIIERDGAFFGYPQTQFIALTDPDLSQFTADEISIVDRIIEIVCNDHTATSISQLTHDQVWEAAQIGEEIPLYTVFASCPREITEDDLEWARAEMTRLEPNRLAA